MQRRNATTVQTLIDTRPSSYRQKEGAIHQAIVIERNVLEWRLDASSSDCIQEALASNSRPVILCNDPYASSLAVDSLHQIGVSKAVDLERGFRSWKKAGLPIGYTVDTSR